MIKLSFIARNAQPAKSGATGPERNSGRISNVHEVELIYADTADKISYLKNVLFTKARPTFSRTRGFDAKARKQKYPYMLDCENYQLVEILACIGQLEKVLFSLQ